MDATSIILALGGASKLAPQIGAKRSAVSNWPKNGIPARYWPVIARLAGSDRATKHITIEVIEAAHQSRLTQIEAA